MTPTSLGRILLVDDDAELVAGLAVALRRAKIDTVTVHSAMEAMRVLEQTATESVRSITVKPIAVILSDLHMPGIDGITLLAHVKANYPDVTRMLLTGEGDVESAAAAVNAGGVFRFLQKPCQTSLLQASVVDAFRQYELVTAERVLLQNTLRGAVKAMTDLLALTNPALFGRATRLATRATDLGRSCGLVPSELWKLELAALFSPLAIAALPDAVVERLKTASVTTESDEAAFDKALENASEVLSHIPRLDDVVESIRHQRASYDGSTPGHPKGEQIPMESRILRLLTDYDVLESSSKLPAPQAAQWAMDLLRTRSTAYDPILLAKLAEILGTRRLQEPSRIMVRDLQVGMRLAVDLHSPTGTLLMARGFEITPTAYARINGWTTGILDQMVQIET